MYLPSADISDAAGLDLFGGESDEGVGAQRAGDLLAKELADRPSGRLSPPKINEELLVDISYLVIMLNRIKCFAQMGSGLCVISSCICCSSLTGKS